MTLPSGTLLGQRYEIRDFVGSDGTLEVYKGLDLRLGRDIAVTVLDIRSLQDPDKLLTFEREAQIRAALHHPRLMTIHDFGHDASCAYQIAEWLEGQSLRKRLKAGPLSWEEALVIGSEVLEGLDVIHARNITLITLDETSVFLHQAVGAKLFAYALRRVDGPGGGGIAVAEREAIRALARTLLDGLTRGTSALDPGLQPRHLAALRALSEDEGPDLRARFNALMGEAPSARKRRGRRFWLAAGLLATCSGFVYLFAHRRPLPQTSHPAQPSGQDPRPAQDTDARRLYLYGLQLLDNRDPESLRRALTYLQGAVTRDPALAPAQSGLGECYGLMGLAGLMAPEEALRQARGAVRHALDLDPRLGEAHGTTAFLDCWYERKFREAEALYRKALEYSPGSARVVHGYGVFLAASGRMEEGLGRLRQAMELEPLSESIRTSYALALHEAGRSPEALAELAKTLEQNPARRETWLARRKVLEQSGRLEESLQTTQKLAELDPGFEREAASLRTAYDARGAKGYWGERVRQLEQQPGTDPVQLAEAVAQLGDPERTFRLLNRALREGSLQAVRIPQDPAFAVLRADPRFAQIRKRLGVSPS